MNEILHSMYVHYTLVLVVAYFIFTCAVNALPPKNQSFNFGDWFREFLTELAQQSPKNFGVTAAVLVRDPEAVTTPDGKAFVLSDTQKRILANANMPVKE